MNSQPQYKIYVKAKLAEGKVEKSGRVYYNLPFVEKSKARVKKS